MSAEDFRNFFSRIRGQAPRLDTEEDVIKEQRNNYLFDFVIKGETIRQLVLNRDAIYRFNSQTPFIMALGETFENFIEEVVKIEIKEMELP